MKVIPLNQSALDSMRQERSAAQQGGQPSARQAGAPRQRGKAQQPKPAQKRPAQQAQKKRVRPRPQQNPQKPDYRQGNEQVRPRHKNAAEVRKANRRRKLWGFAAVLAVVVLGVVLSINLLFKVGDFRVQNFDRSTPANTGIYTEEEILSLLKIEPGESLFGISTKDKTELLLTALPYLEKVQVSVSPPSTVVVSVQPAKETFVLPYGVNWLVLSETMRIIRIADSEPMQVPVLQASLSSEVSAAVGNTALLMNATARDEIAHAEADRAQRRANGETVPEPGEEEQQEQQNRITEPNLALADLMTGLDTYGLMPGLTDVDLTNMDDITFIYKGRILVKLGTRNNMSYKLHLVSTALLDTEKGLTDSDIGVLDVSYTRSDGEIYAYFQPGTVYSQYRWGEALPEEPPTDLPPTIMVDGTLYQDTGRDSTAETRKEEPDGTITTKVESFELPGIDDQSNFGTGLAYEYGETEGTIEVELESGWRVFAVVSPEEEPEDAEQPEDGGAPTA